MNSNSQPDVSGQTNIGSPVQGQSDVAPQAPQQREVQPADPSPIGVQSQAPEQSNVSFPALGQPVLIAKSNVTADVTVNPNAQRQALGQLKLRKSVTSLSDDELGLLREAFRKMMAISDNRGYQYYAGIHGLPLQHCVHHRPLFIPWHRAYLYFFGQALQDQVAGVTVPWWDWSSEQAHQEGVPQAFTDDHVNGQPNPLCKFHIKLTTRLTTIDRDTRRFPGNPSKLPDSNKIEKLLSLSNFTDFANSLEDIHNSIHFWTGGRQGDMASIPTAAYDPIFWAHHSMVDRLWYLWQLRHNNNGMPSQMLGQVLVPFNMTVADTLDIHKLGYEYASSAVFTVRSV